MVKISHSSCYSFNDWVFKDIIGDVKNKSAKVEELIIKGWFADKSNATFQETILKLIGINF